MRTTRLNIPDAITTDTANITLDADASRYLCKVMRYDVGDQVVLFNGDGNDYTASILNVGKSVQLQIHATAKNNSESPLHITLVQALAKGTKLDLIIQKATELGVNRISPVSTERTVLQVEKRRSERKLEHWNKIASSACAQCNRSVVPSIDPIVELSEWFTAHASEHSVLIDPAATSSFKALAPHTALNILVGPEGGFSDNELALAHNCGVTTVRCGPRVLRTETAGFAAIAIVQALIGDMG